LYHERDCALASGRLITHEKEGFREISLFGNRRDRDAGFARDRQCDRGAGKATRRSHGGTRLYLIRWNARNPREDRYPGADTRLLHSQRRRDACAPEKLRPTRRGFTFRIPPEGERENRDPKTGSPTGFPRGRHGALPRRA